MDTATSKLLDTIEVGVLATVNPDQTPLATPLHFARWNDHIIWISDNTARHSHNLAYNDNVEFVVWDEQKNAIFITTTAHEVTDQSLAAAARQAYQDKLGDFLPGVETPRIYAAPVGQRDENSTTEKWVHYVA